MLNFRHLPNLYFTLLLQISRLERAAIDGNANEMNGMTNANVSVKGLNVTKGRGSMNKQGDNQSVLASLEDEDATQIDVTTNTSQVTVNVRGSKNGNDRPARVGQDVKDKYSKWTYYAVL